MLRLSARIEWRWRCNKELIVTDLNSPGLGAEVLLGMMIVLAPLRGAGRISHQSRMLYIKHNYFGPLGI